MVEINIYLSKIPLQQEHLPCISYHTQWEEKAVC